MDRIEIDHRRHRKDPVLLGCLSLWSLGIAGVVAFFAITHVWPGFWIFGAMLVFVVVLSFRRARVIQSVVIDDEFLTVFENHREEPIVKVIRKQRIEVTLENLDTGDSIESIKTLNLWCPTAISARERHTLGWSLNDASKKELFTRIVDSLRAHGFEVEAHEK